MVIKMNSIEKIFIVLPLLFIFFIVNAQAQSRPILAVPNIKATDVSESEASACRNMIEIAMIRTGNYNVISYTDIEQILEAQEFSLSDCTDEACAVEIGKLLAAEQIVVGELSGLGGEYVLSVRLIDVRTGITINADFINIGKIEDFQEKAFIVAYALAGLKYIPESQLVIRETGSIYIIAIEGDELEVFLDGVRKGKTPLLVENIMFGTHFLEAKSDKYNYSREISIQNKDIVEITADISQLQGNLLIDYRPAQARGFKLYIDEQELKPGLIRNLTIGKKPVTVSGNGWYFEGEILIEQDKTAQYTIDLRSIGEVMITIPEGGRAVIEGDKPVSLTSSKFIQLETGEYSITFSHPDYEKYQTVFYMDRGEKKNIEPNLEFNQIYLDKQLLTELIKERNRVEKVRKFFNIGIITGLTTSTLGLGATFTFEWKIGREKDILFDTYSAYENSTISSEIDLLRESIESSQQTIDGFRSYRSASLMSLGAGAIISTILFFLKPSIKTLDARIEEIESRIK
jgi:hypothetical protein